MLEGNVKTANSRGFGFIETKSGIDYYFHYTGYTGDWKQLLLRIARDEKPAVKFENDSTAINGPRAIKVEPTI